MLSALCILNRQTVTANPFCGSGGGEVRKDEGPTGRSLHCGKALQAAGSGPPLALGAGSQKDCMPGAGPALCPAPNKHYQALPWETRKSNRVTAAPPALRPPASGSEWSLGNHPLPLQEHRHSGSARDSSYKTTQHSRTPNPASSSPVFEGPFLFLGGSRWDVKWKWWTEADGQHDPNFVKQTGCEHTEMLTLVSPHWRS